MYMYKIHFQILSILHASLIYSKNLMISHQFFEFSLDLLCILDEYTLYLHFLIATNANLYNRNSNITVLFIIE